jgi:hypothetical protein
MDDLCERIDILDETLPEPEDASWFWVQLVKVSLIAVEQRLQWQ